VFAYSSRTDKPTSTKHGTPSPSEQEEILEKQELIKLSLIQFPVEKLP
jgi:hypothetical protein